MSASLQPIWMSRKTSIPRSRATSTYSAMRSAESRPSQVPSGVGWDCETPVITWKAGITSRSPFSRS